MPVTPRCQRLVVLGRKARVPPSSTDRDRNDEDPRQREGGTAEARGGDAVGEGDVRLPRRVRPGHGGGVVDGGAEDGHQDGRADRPADHADRLHGSRRGAGVLRCDAGQDGAGQRRVQQADAGPEQHHRAEDAAEVRGVRRHLRQPHHAQQDQGQADEHGRLRTQPVDQPGRDPGRNGKHEQCHRQKRHTGPEGAQPQDLLDVLGQQEERPEHRRAGADEHQEAAAAVTVREQPQFQDRLGVRSLDGDEGRQEQHADHEGADGYRLGPTRLCGVDEPVDQGRGAQRRGERAAGVEPPALHRGDREELRRQQADHQAERHVDQQHPTPRDGVGEEAAEEQAARRTQTGRHDEDPEGTVALLFLLEGADDERQRGRRGQRPADTLGDAGDQEQPRVRGQATEQRGDGEQSDTDDQRPAVAEDVPHSATQQQQATVGQGVGVEHPGQPGGAEVEFLLDLWQRHVHDGNVDTDHQLNGQDQCQDHSTVPCRGRHRVLCGTRLVRGTGHRLVPFGETPLTRVGCVR
nr:hypothetical protein [Micromonospora sp. ATCC 39149]